MTQRMFVFGSEGYIGGTVRAAAERQHVQVYGVSSSAFDFWESDQRSSWQDVRVDTAILAADFERRVAPYVPDPQAVPDKTLVDLGDQFRRLLSRIRARRVLFLSTDAVFDGKEGGYVEDHSPNPVTPNAHAKHRMEQVACTFHNVHVVRTSLVYGNGATKLDRRREHLLAETAYGKSVSVPTTVFRSPIHVDQVAASLLRLALVSVDPPRIVHLVAPRRSLYETYREYVLPERVRSIHGHAGGVHEDTSLNTRDDSWLRVL